MTLTIDINDSVADKILYFLDHFKDDVRVVDNSPMVEYDYEKNYPKSVVVSSVEEVRRRVYEAEQRIEEGEYISENEYERQMDKFFKEELGIVR